MKVDLDLMLEDLVNSGQGVVTGVIFDALKKGISLLGFLGHLQSPKRYSFLQT